MTFRQIYYQNLMVVLCESMPKSIASDLSIMPKQCSRLTHEKLQFKKTNFTTFCHKTGQLHHC